MGKKLTISELRSKLELYHPELSFPNVADEYKDCYSYITGKCAIHGLFKATYTNLCHGIRKTGCPSCWEDRRKLTNKIDNNTAYANLQYVHGDKLSFPQFLNEYNNYHSKITAVCPIHGEFISSYMSMYSQKTGCPKCGIIKQGITRRIDTFIIKKNLASLNNNLSFPHFDIEYEHTRSDITTVCPIHGEFISNYIALYHNNTGCLQCFHDRARNDAHDILKRLTDRYSQLSFPDLITEYRGVDSPITVICKIHGVFMSNYRRLFYSNHGCHMCGRESMMAIPGHPGVAKYESWYLEIPIDDNPTKGPDGELQVQCKTCKQLFTPSGHQVHCRIRCINTLGQGDGNFYCSDSCKQQCSIYGKRNDNHILTQNVTDYEAKVKLARNCQLETKRVLRQHQMDQYGYHFCEKCGKVVDNPELHHTIEVAKDPSGAITIAGQMLVCGECHKEFTRMCR